MLAIYQHTRLVMQICIFSRQWFLILICAISAQVVVDWWCSIVVLLRGREGGGREGCSPFLPLTAHTHKKFTCTHTKNSFAPASGYVVRLYAHLAKPRTQPLHHTTTSPHIHTHTQ